MKKNLIAPCGMNCGICMAFLRPTNKCPGCRSDDTDKPITRIGCKIKTCGVFHTSKAIRRRLSLTERYDVFS